MDVHAQTITAIIVCALAMITALVACVKGIFNFLHKVLSSLEENTETGKEMSHDLKSHVEISGQVHEELSKRISDQAIQIAVINATNSINQSNNPPSTSNPQSPPIT